MPFDIARVDLSIANGLASLEHSAGRVEPQSPTSAQALSWAPLAPQPLHHLSNMLILHKLEHSDCYFALPPALGEWNKIL
eukprot:2484891-Amphidinium_carterae.1